MPSRQRHSHGQSSVELLLVLAVTVLVLTVFILLSQQKLGDVSTLKEQNDAKNAVQDISAAAKEVYSQGEGARKQVYVYIPSNYDPLNSSIANRSIRLSVRGTDYNAAEDFYVHGNWPGTPGGHYVWVTSEGSRVRIGIGMFSLSDDYIYILMERNTTTNRSFSVENEWNTSLSMTPALHWANSNVTITMSPSSQFQLAIGNSGNMLLTVFADASAVGFYNGDVELIAVDANGNTESIRVPVVVEVIGYGRGIAPPLSVTPPLWNETLMPGNSSTKVFTVCTNIQTGVTGVTLTPSTLAPGTWVSRTSAMGPISKGSCATKILTITIPPGATSGLYTGSIVFEGQGATGATDAVSLYITVGGNATDNIGPLVTGITLTPAKVFTNTPFTAYINATDLNRGNSTITGCEMDVDYRGRWQQMFPADGVYDSVTEGANGTYTAGLTKGDHTVLFRCTDSRGNVGPVANYTLKVMRNFLFITKVDFPDNKELDWVNWVATHRSAAGFNWQYDTASDEHVLDGTVNLSYYGAVLMPDYHPSSSLAIKLNPYVSGGGRVIFLGMGMQEGPHDVGITTSPGTNGGNSIYVVTNSHYITSSLIQNQTYAIFSGGGGSRSVKNDFTGTRLCTSDPSKGNTILGDGGGYLVWGVRTPAGMSSYGITITTRSFDYSLLNSTITPG